jgi:site-specific DNA recombinase
MLVRTTFERYLALGSVIALAEALAVGGIHAPAPSTATGMHIGGVPFSRGPLYLILKNRTYLSQIEHKGSIYPRLHVAIVELELWERARALLAGNTQGVRSGPRHRNPSPLAGLITDAPIATHVTPTSGATATVRARLRGVAAALRIPAREIESAVAEKIATLFDDPLELAAAAQLTVQWTAMRTLPFAQKLAARLRQKEQAVARELVTNVAIRKDGFNITLDVPALGQALGLSADAEAGLTLTLAANVRLTRSGRMLRLVHDSDAARHVRRSDR